MERTLESYTLLGAVNPVAGVQRSLDLRHFTLFTGGDVAQIPSLAVCVRAINICVTSIGAA